MAHKKNPAAVALGRKGGIKGGPARAAMLTAAQRSESARKAVQARWARVKKGSDYIVRSEAAPATPALDTSKKALHLCLKRIKDAKNENQLRRLTEELLRKSRKTAAGAISSCTVWCRAAAFALQRIVFHKQYQNGEN